MEIACVVLLAMLFVDFIMAFVSPSAVSLRDYNELKPQKQMSLSNGSAYQSLKNFDAFHRSVVTGHNEGQSAAPESSLQLTIYGLRAKNNGQGSVILKMQGEQQKRYSVGDNIKSSMRLIGVYADRIEISRAGVRESVFYIQDKNKRKNQLNKTQFNKNQAISQVQDREEKLRSFMSALDLKPLRQNKRIWGFYIGNNADLLYLGALQLQRDDVILQLNDRKLTNFEKLEDVIEETSLNQDIQLRIERRGEPMQIVIAAALIAEGMK